MEILYALSALDDEGLLTRLGRKMAEFPLDPPLAKMVCCYIGLNAMILCDIYEHIAFFAFIFCVYVQQLIQSTELRCSEEVLSIVAMLNIQNVFYRPKEKMAEADAKKAKFFQPEGIIYTHMYIYERTCLAPINV